MTLGRAARVPAGQKRGQARAGAPGGPPARRACRELIRPPARGRHRNHSAAPAPGARGNGPVELTSPDSASRGATACRLLPGGRRGAGRTARGRRGRGGAVTGPPPPPPARPAGADTPVSLGLSNCPDARRPPFPETAAGPGRSGGLGWPRFPGAGVSPTPGPSMDSAHGAGEDDKQRAPTPATRRTAPCASRARPLGAAEYGSSRSQDGRWGGVQGAVPARPQEVRAAARLNRSGWRLRAWLRFSDASPGPPTCSAWGRGAGARGAAGGNWLTFALGGAYGWPGSRQPGRGKAGTPRP